MKNENDYQELPPPPPDPPPDEPPPDEPPPELDGLEAIADEADCMAAFIKCPKEAWLKAVLPEYQSGGVIAMFSNFLIHTFDMPSTIHVIPVRKATQ